MTPITVEIPDPMLMTITFRPIGGVIPAPVSLVIDREAADMSSRNLRSQSGTLKGWVKVGHENEHLTLQVEDILYITVEAL